MQSTKTTPAAMSAQDARELLKEHGLRYSKPRAFMLGYFLEQDRHVSADRLYLDLKERGHNVSLSTVYLNLNALSDAGLVHEFKGLSGETLFDSNVQDHHHLICEATGESIDVPVIMVDGKPITQFIKEQAEALTGWQIREPELVLRGVPQPRDTQPMGTASIPQDNRPGSCTQGSSTQEATHNTVMKHRHETPS